VQGACSGSAYWLRGWAAAAARADSRTALLPRPSRRSGSGEGRGRADRRRRAAPASTADAPRVPAATRPLRTRAARAVRRALELSSTEGRHVIVGRGARRLGRALARWLLPAAGRLPERR